MNTSASDNESGMTVLAMAFRLARGKPLACYMCKHSNMSETRLCTLGLYSKAWNRMWRMLVETKTQLKTYGDSPLHHRQSNHSAAEFCTSFEYGHDDMLNSRDQMLLNELTKV